VVLGEVGLRRLEELVPVVACELCPALAVGDPAMLFVDLGHGPSVVATVGGRPWTAPASW
jgi:hypothetical protein